MENSTDNANRTAQAPYGRACLPVASLPSPRRFASAYRGHRPLKNGWPAARQPTKARQAAPAPAPPSAHTSSTAPAKRPPKAGWQGKAACRGRGPHRTAVLTGRPQVERQEERRRPGERQASTVSSGEAGHRTATRPRRNAQEARNQTRAGDRCRQPRETPPRPAQGRISPPSRSRPGWPRPDGK